MGVLMFIGCPMGDYAGLKYPDGWVFSFFSLENGNLKVMPIALTVEYTYLAKWATDHVVVFKCQEQWPQGNSRSWAILQKWTFLNKLPFNRVLSNST